MTTRNEKLRRIPLLPFYLLRDIFVFVTMPTARQIREEIGLMVRDDLSPIIEQQVDRAVSTMRTNMEESIRDMINSVEPKGILGKMIMSSFKGKKNESICEQKGSGDDI